jgi:hypothetical protein
MTFLRCIEGKPKDGQTARNKKRIQDKNLGG